MKPPFRPAVARPDDTFYFDSEFTSRTPKGQRSHRLSSVKALKQIFFLNEILCFIPRLPRCSPQRWSPPALPRLQLYSVNSAGGGRFGGAGQASATPSGAGESVGVDRIQTSGGSSSNETSVSTATTREEPAVQRWLRAERRHRHGLLLCLQTLHPQSHQHGIRGQGTKANK